MLDALHPVTRRDASYALSNQFLDSNKVVGGIIPPNETIIRYNLPQRSQNKVYCVLKIANTEPRAAHS